MNKFVHIFFPGLFLGAAVFLAAELIAPGSVAPFFPVGIFFLILITAWVLLAQFPLAQTARLYPIITALLTGGALVGTIVFAWQTGADLGKVRILIVAGAGLVATGALRSIFKSSE